MYVQFTKSKFKHAAIQWSYGCGCYWHDTAMNDLIHTGLNGDGFVSFTVFKELKCIKRNFYSLAAAIFKCKCNS